MVASSAAPEWEERISWLMSGEDPFSHPGKFVNVFRITLVSFSGVFRVGGPGASRHSPLSARAHRSGRRISSRDGRPGHDLGSEPAHLDIASALWEQWRKLGNLLEVGLLRVGRARQACIVRHRDQRCVQVKGTTQIGDHERAPAGHGGW